MAEHPVAIDATLVAVVGAISFGLAAVSYVVLERPFLRLKERWAPA